jgi:hypothetical protein
VGLDDPEHQIARKLDQLVGKSFHEDAKETPGKRWRNAIVKVVVAALCAVATAGLVFYGIESHRLPPAAQMPPPKPVTVQILPSPKPP